jgi:zinc D-Ala-D-Ala dipeptidase
MTVPIDKFNDRRVLGYRDLVDTPVLDNDEPLVRIDPDPNLGIEFATLEYPHIRKDAWQRVLNAAQSLRAKNLRYGLRILYAYRSLRVQRELFEQEKDRASEESLGIPEDELLERVHGFIAVPDVAGHPTGGAIDLTITFDGVPLDMGCEYMDFDSPLLPTFAEGLSPAQEENRMLLREIMMRAGFAPFNGEWWHFSYGDKEWAVFYDIPRAIYSQVDGPVSG